MCCSATQHSLESHHSVAKCRAVDKVLHVCCGVLQSVAVYCSVLQCLAVCCIAIRNSLASHHSALPDIARLYR